MKYDVNVILCPFATLNKEKAKKIAIRHIDEREKIIVKDSKDKEFRFLKSELMKGDG